VILPRSAVPSIYALTDRIASGRAHDVVVRELVVGGIRWIQLREKELDDAAFFAQAQRAALELPAEVCLLINDRPDLALGVMADGVHLGQEDLPPAQARALPGGGDLIIGYSTHSVDEALLAAADAAVDYLAIGPIFVSSTKNVRSPLGLEALRRLRDRTEKPIVAIGGIDRSNVRSVIEAGADGCAVVAALYRGGSIVENAAALIDAAGASR
jgi:thiamine-phosphate pyrophosphorylase